MSIRLRFISLFSGLFIASQLFGQAGTSGCSSCATWNLPQEPFKIYGNTYYVGPHGLGVLLITSDTGHVLIDGALAESVPQIVAHVRQLGFRVEDIKLILNTHVHYDHAGGIAELQKLSGARVAASQWTADVMKTGEVARDDPQFGSITGIAPVANVEVFKEGAVLKAGGVTVTSHSTPGHTPGGTSWTWQSCEKGKCLQMVYADSVTAVSSDGYLFSRHNGGDFEKSFAFFESTPCDILITPHPDISNLWQRQAVHNFVDTKACRALAEKSRENLKVRLAKESGH